MATTRPSDPARKARGAFFTPAPIADYLTAWAIDGRRSATVLDPTCGEAVFLLSAARRLAALGCSSDDLDHQVFGVDIHSPSLREAAGLLEDEGLDAHLVESDFFALKPSGGRSGLPTVDAVVGNPPFVRYQHHRGEARIRSQEAALAQGVKLSRLASSWAALLVHATGFLKPDGRLAMVLPAELLTVHYAEPVRRWLRQRFAAVNLVMFERLQFDDALEKVVLVMAEGTGGCERFSLWYVQDADSLATLRPFDHLEVQPADEGKWSDLLLTPEQRVIRQRAEQSLCVPLSEYGSPELGLVTGANAYFAISESSRQALGIETEHLARISPPGTRHLKGLSFGAAEWRRLLDEDAPVWLFRPPLDHESDGVAAYIAAGEALGIDKAYKCSIRDPWWRPPPNEPPDLFFTYMSHRFPRLIANAAGVGFLNSMHGIRLRDTAPAFAREALPLLALSSLTMLGAELYGRSYGGGVLKMEPREASRLPVPNRRMITAAWGRLKPERSALDRALRTGRWAEVSKRVDSVFLHDIAGLSWSEIDAIRTGLAKLRRHRLGKA